MFCQNAKNAIGGGKKMDERSPRTGTYFCAELRNVWKWLNLHTHEKFWFGRNATAIFSLVRTVALRQR